MTRPGTTPGILNTARGFRRVWHLLIAGAAWALFVRWWWIVLDRGVSPFQVTATVLFLIGSIVVVVAVTGLWVLHNLRIAQKRPRRRSTREMKLEWTRDRLGRPLVLAPEMRTARLLTVRLHYDRKVYEPDPGAGA